MHQALLGKVYKHYLAEDYRFLAQSSKLDEISGVEMGGKEDTWWERFFYDGTLIECTPQETLDFMLRLGQQ